MSEGSFEHAKHSSQMIGGFLCFAWLVVFHKPIKKVG